jgi:hypothetical protein
MKDIDEKDIEEIVDRLIDIIPTPAADNLIRALVDKISEAREQLRRCQANYKTLEEMFIQAEDDRLAKRKTPAGKNPDGGEDKS